MRRAIYLAVSDESLGEIRLGRFLLPLRWSCSCGESGRAWTAFRAAYRLGWHQSGHRHDEPAEG